MSHDELYDQALDSINDLFNDQSIPKQDVIDSLNGLVDEIMTMIESLATNDED